jgi:hypothetical protein
LAGAFTRSLAKLHPSATLLARATPSELAPAELAAVRNESVASLTDGSTLPPRGKAQERRKRAAQERQKQEKKDAY